jgi:putative oxidoreductase
MPDAVLLFVRAGAGLMLALLHGRGKIAGAYGKIFQGQEWGFVGYVSSLGFPMATFFAVCAAVTEFFVALMLAAGLFTRYAAALVAVNMAVAAYTHIISDMKYELAAIYGLVSLAFVVVDPGRFSVDGWRRSRRKS